MLRGQRFTFTLIQVIIISVVKATTLLRKKGKGIQLTSVNSNRRPRRPIVTGFNFRSYNDRSIKISHLKGSF